jgi:hypothetical protein
MGRLREQDCEAGRLRSYHSISPNLARVGAPALEFMCAAPGGAAYVADVIRAVGRKWAETKGGQHTMLVSFIGGGVEVGGYVLTIEDKPTGRPSLYQKTKLVRAVRGTLESVVGPPAEEPSSTLSLSTLARGARPLVHNSSLAGAERLEAGLDHLQACVEELESRVDAAFSEIAAEFESLTARIAKLEGSDL